MAKNKEPKFKIKWKETPLSGLLIVLNVVIFFVFGPIFTGEVSDVFLLSRENGFNNPIALLASGFMHGSVIHLGVNMLSLYFLRGLEYSIGSKLYIITYGVSLLGSSIFVASFSELPTVGASGAIFGLLGLLLVFKPFAAMRKSLIPILIINVIITVLIPNISWQAHLGGFIAGCIVGFVLNYRQPIYGDPHQPSVVPIIEEER